MVIVYNSWANFIIHFIGEDTISLERGESSSPLDTSYEGMKVGEKIKDPGI